MKKSLFILATLCFCSNGFPQSIKNNEVDYEKNILKKGASKPFVSDLSDWRIFKNNEELDEKSTIESPTTIITNSPATVTTDSPTTVTTDSPTTVTTDSPTTVTTDSPTTVTTDSPTTVTTDSPTTVTTDSPTTVTTSLPPSTTTPKGNGATFNFTSFSMFGILIFVHSICKYIYV